MALDLDFTLEQVGDVRLDQLILLEHFQSDDETRLFFTGDEYVAELATTELPTKLKITQLPLLGFKHRQVGLELDH